MFCSKKKIGRFGEERAVEFLKKKGYKIIERNYVMKIGEIDIIAQKKDVITFVEVKTIKANQNFFPQDKVNFFKKRKLRNLCKIYFAKNRFKSLKWQIDIIGIHFIPETKDIKIYHFENAIEDD